MKKSSGDKVLHRVSTRESALNASSKESELRCFPSVSLSDPLRLVADARKKKRKCFGVFMAQYSL